MKGIPEKLVYNCHHNIVNKILKKRFLTLTSTVWGYNAPGIEKKESEIGSRETRLEIHNRERP